ncbi:ribose-phosphate diphosphokinase [Candidatus Methanomassiliicoccus intestinalis]|uniref:Ribose-phosphate pyrophosphokinase n=3 Tax=Candidatus Methanomassiliicoccus intestinalis TaxID=1406512 RepID=R9TBQ9_METII|nr:ribose-phosphate diphosphokinase [Candidatus Methanomassiliicoccus intestinalis]AGN27131.1 ribose-phosphate pyrophosphokinase [Candidatus Methanomassiliicoccus intestinalis Issoire-Mx1]TQS80905.1 MAG: ribose-phosphate pyrophosphokinase [Candidatus Methanomassiliicoccus intestinalis]TQS83909.1 MAG: ribose-phosphate pyrophosphokinase [Candidatus Methanomassiliicoccus intestinalis]
MIVIGGTSSKKLAQDLAKELDSKYVQAQVSRFPDGECYVRIEEDALDDDVIVVQNTHPDNNLVEMLLIQDAALGLGAKSVTSVVPYFGYSRQDERFNKGEALSAKVMVDIMGLTSTRLASVDVHKPVVLDWFAGKTYNISAAHCIGEFFKDSGIDLVLAPDEGALDRAAAVAEAIHAEFDNLEKTRLSGEVVRMAPKNVDAKDKSVLIVDDIISTGGTIEAAANQLKVLGAKSVIAVCTHGLFAKDALDRLRKCCNAVYSTNTIENEVSVISVAPEIAKVLRD